MSKYKFTLRRKPSFKGHYCVERELVYGDTRSSMVIGTITHSRKSPTWAKGNKYLANVSWASEGRSAFRTQQEAREYLEQRFLERFMDMDFVKERMTEAK